jgi:hypothetical protein
MPKSNRKLQSIPLITPKTVDDELAEHLKQAEHHLIGAITLFSGPRRPTREGTYLRRLTGAQETITWLYRQELIRIRGPFKPKRGKK